MKLLVALLSVCIFSNYVSAVSFPISTRADNNVVDNISHNIVEWIGRMLQYLFDLMDLKTRSVRFVSSLYTTDNLGLVKRVLNIGLRFGGWLYDVIPNTSEEGLTRFWSYVFPSRGTSHKETDDFSYDEVEPAGFEKKSSKNEDDNFIDNFTNQAMSLHNLINPRGV